MIEINPSPTQKIEFLEREIYIKRDDLLHPDFSGNKARKFYHFLKMSFDEVDTLISHGSIQSNAMYSLSVLAKLRGWKFKYFVKSIPSYLKNNPHGNYKYALQNSMELHVGKAYKTFLKNELFIPEGGACKESEEGIKLLAKEINSEFEGRDIDIFLPSGTGTTALYLQKHTNFRIFTTAVVADANYLKEQFLELERSLNRYPIILESKNRYYFGKLYCQFFDIWIELKNKTGIEFDLLYDPKGWIVLKENIDLFKKDILYIHQGGLIGNESMLRRYKREGICKF